MKGHSVLRVTTKDLGRRVHDRRRRYGRQPKAGVHLIHIWVESSLVRPQSASFLFCFSELKARKLGVSDDLSIGRICEPTSGALAVLLETCDKKKCQSALLGKGVRVAANYKLPAAAAWSYYRCTPTPRDGLNAGVTQWNLSLQTLVESKRCRPGRRVRYFWG